jgi:hypothetical protein
MRHEWNTPPGCIVYYANARDGRPDFFGIFRGSRVTVDETHELDLDGVTALSVNCASGTVKVIPGDEPKVTMTGALWTPEQKDEYLSVTENDGRISVVFELDTALFSWSDIDITVTLPKDCGLNLDLACASADTTLQNLRLGDVSINCASGRTNFTDCTGGALDINTASGGVDIEGCAFDSIHTVCQSGDIDIRDTQGATTVRCTSGRVSITEVEGALDISNTSGGVTVQLTNKEIQPINIDVTSGSLALYLNAEAAFNLDAQTT